MDTLIYQSCQLGGGKLGEDLHQNSDELGEGAEWDCDVCEGVGQKGGTGDESGEVFVWDWSNNSMVRVVTLVRLVGTVMSLASDME